MKINLHIERLVLDGLPIDHHDAPLVQAAVETELTRLLVAEGLHSPLNFSSGATPRVTAPRIQELNQNPVQAGAQIARAVHGGLTR
jgi:hypothetical protein